MTTTPEETNLPLLARPTRTDSRALFICIAAVIGYACLAWIAVQTKSPTYDEPLHAVGAWMHLHRMDFRVNPEDPPLWHYWAALPNGPDALKPEAHEQALIETGQDVFNEWKFVSLALFQTPGIDVITFFQRSRAMMLVIAIVLAIVVMHWSWKLAGGVAAAAAGVLFCFDPNFLGHGALVKNDVSMTCVMLALATAIWYAGRRLTIFNASMVAVLCAAGVLIKFSAILLGPISAMLLLSRAALPMPWTVFGRRVRSRLRRFYVAVALCVFCGLFTWVSIWAAYGFRYQPTPYAGVGLNTSSLVDQVATNQLSAKADGRKPTPEELRAWRPDRFLSSVLYAEQNRVLPQAYTNGLVYTYQSTFYHNAFLMGRFSWTGWWYYFPVALALKSSIAMWIAALLAVAVVIVAAAAKSGESAKAAKPSRVDHWALLSLTIPPTIYFLSAIRTNLNIGVRHIFPMMPFLMIGIALAASFAWKRWGKPARIVTLSLAALLVAESLYAFPNYISFFNVALGGPRGGIRLLSDSNLDWGQDLPALAQWQKEHGNVPIWISYFGTTEPSIYGIKFHKLRPLPQSRAVLAISATTLQGTYLNDEYAQDKPLYERIQNNCPLIDVLGGTIYLFDYDPARDHVE